MFSEGSHRDVDQLFVEVLLNDLDHHLQNLILLPKSKMTVAVGIIKDHLIDGDRNPSHLLHNFLLFDSLPASSRKQNGILNNHGVIVSEVTGKEDGPHIALKQDHSRARDMLGIKEPKINKQASLDLNSLFLVVFANVNVFYFGIFVYDEFLREFAAVDVAVVPQWR